MTRATCNSPDASRSSPRLLMRRVRMQRAPTASSRSRLRTIAPRERDSLAAVDTGECLAAHSAVSLRAADGCIRRMMRKRAGARLTAGAALLLSSGIRLLVRHALNCLSPRSGRVDSPDDAHAGRREPDVRRRAAAFLGHQTAGSPRTEQLRLVAASPGCDNALIGVDSAIVLGIDRRFAAGATTR